MNHCEERACEKVVSLTIKSADQEKKRATMGKANQCRKKEG